MAKLNNKQTLIATVRYLKRTHATFPTPLVSHCRLIALIVPLYFDNKGPSEQFAEVLTILTGSQRDVVYLD